MLVRLAQNMILNCEIRQLFYFFSSFSISVSVCFGICVCVYTSECVREQCVFTYDSLWFVLNYSTCSSKSYIISAINKVVK